MATFYNWVIAGASREDYVGHFGSWVRKAVKQDPGEVSEKAWRRIVSGAPKTQVPGLTSSMLLSLQEFQLLNRGGPVKEEDTREVRTVESTLAILRRTIKADGFWGKPEEYREEIQLRAFQGPVSRVGTRASLTVSLGNFEMAKVESVVEIPCYTEEIEDVSNAASAYAIYRIDRDLDELVGVRANPNRIAEMDRALDSFVVNSDKKFDGPSDTGLEDDSEEKEPVAETSWEAPGEADAEEVLF